MRQGLLQVSVVIGDQVTEPSLWRSELAPRVLSHSSTASPWTQDQN